MSSSAVAATGPAELDRVESIDVGGVMIPRSISESSRPGRKMRASVTSRLLGNLQRESQNKGTWITGLLFLASDVGFDKVKQLLSERLLTMKRFRAKMGGRSFPPQAIHFRELAIEEMDMDYHFKQALHEGDPVSEDELIKYVQNVYHGWKPDMSKALWQVEYIPRLDDGRACIVVKISHIVGDGVSLVEVLMKHMIDQPEVQADGDGPGADGKGKREDFEPKKKRVNKLHYGPLNRAAIFMRGVFSGLTVVTSAPDKYNSLRVKKLTDSSDKRRFAFTEKVSLDRIKEVKGKFEGATVNDVLILLLTKTMQAYYEEVKDPAVLKKHRRVRAQFPISTRGRNAPAFRDGDPRNMFSYGFLTFYMNEKGSMVDLFWKIKRSLDQIKLSPAPYVTTANANSLLPILPLKLINWASLSVGKKATGQLSNVAGPNGPAFFGGVGITDIYFQLHCPLAVYLGVLSFNSVVTCSICLEDKLGVDPNLIAKHWGPQFEKIYEEAMKIEGTLKQPTRATDCL